MFRPGGTGERGGGGVVAEPPAFLNNIICENLLEYLFVFFVYTFPNILCIIYI